MSELNELIATSASHAYHAGELHERDRILTLFLAKQSEYFAAEKLADSEGDDDTAIFYEMAIRNLDELVELIKGEQK